MAAQDSTSSSNNAIVYHDGIGRSSELSTLQKHGKWPSPLLPIEVENIKLSKHTSDSGVYESMTPKEVELDEMLQANRKPNDYGGWIGALSEWKILYLIGKDKNGILPKETIRGVYDGSLFESMAKKHASN
nr:probable peroxygenase 5 isoform X1 [Ipomoea batatas]